MSNENREEGTNVNYTDEDLFGGLSDYFNNLSKKSDPEQIIQWYRDENYDQLATCQMDEPLDEKGNTLMHYMARDLNKEAILQIMSRNPRLISYNCVNKCNNKYDKSMPIHMALDTLIEKDIDDHSFIDFMIHQLLAATNIADGKNRVIKLQDEDLLIHPFNNEESQKKVQDIYDMNEDVLHCINRIVESEAKIRDKICGKDTDQKPLSKKRKHRKAHPKKHIYEDENREALPVKNIYKDLQPTKEAEFSECEDNVLSILSLPFREMSKERDIQNAIEVLKYHEEEKSKLSQAGGNKESEGSNGSETGETTSEQTTEEQSTEEQSTTEQPTKTASRNRDPDSDSGDEWNFKESRKNRSFDIKGKEDLMRKIRDAEDDSGDSVDSDESDKNDRARHLSEAEQKKRDEYNNTYKKFAQTIMDKMSVDEDTAKVYRAYVKFTVIEQNKGKELFKRSNEGERLKKMDEIISDTKKLKKLLENVDVDAIKKILNEDREKRLQDSEKNTSKTQKSKASKDSDSSDSSEAPVSKKKTVTKKDAKETKDTKGTKETKGAKGTKSVKGGKKKEKKKLQEGSLRRNKSSRAEIGKYKINSEGYIHSDEVIISQSDS